MKQNYNLLTSSTAFPHAWNSFFQKSKTHAGSLLVVLFMLFGFSDAFGQVVQTFTSSTTWTVPAGVTSVTVECWGGGGGGGNASHPGNGTSRGGGGAGGAYASKVITVAPGTYTITIGNGGAAATAGGDTWFGTAATVLAKGGASGASGSKTNGTGGAGTTFESIGDIVHQGGNGGNSSNANGSGGGGGGAGSSGNGANATNITGGAATIDFGGAGANGVTTNNDGSNGSIYGGGGSGAVSIGNPGPLYNGGLGAPGFMRITYTPPIACTGTPTAGTTSPATQNITSGNTANLAVSGYSVASGITFQWQQSASAGGPFVNVTGGTGATTANYTTASLTTTTYYRCVVTCTNGGSTANSSVAEVVVANQILVSGSGTNSVTCGTNAVLKDHAGDANYTANRDDWSVINAGLGATITLSGNYVTEAAFDEIRIYDGTGIGGAVLATFSGTGTINYTGNPGRL